MNNDDRVDIPVFAGSSGVGREARDDGSADLTDAPLWALLDCFPRAVFLVDSADKVSAMNAAARHLLAGSDRIVVDRDRHLRIGDGANRQVDEVIAAARSATIRQPLVLSVACRQLDSSRIDLAAIRLGDGGVAVVVSDRASHAITSAAALRELYGFTAAEQRVVSALVAGASVREAAERLGIAMNTIRRHLKKIFSKSGAARQSDLVRLVTCGPAMLLLDDPPPSSPDLGLMPFSDSRGGAGVSERKDPTTGALRENRSGESTPRAVGPRMSYTRRH